MKSIKVTETTYLLLLSIILIFTHCKKNTAHEEQTDDNFIEFINDKTLAKSIKRIDSLAKFNTYSTHQTGLLYYEKGRILGEIKKDAEAVGSLTQALVSLKKKTTKHLLQKQICYWEILSVSFKY